MKPRLIHVLFAAALATVSGMAQAQFGNMLRSITGAFSLAAISIWRTRSRVNPMERPISSNVFASSPSSPNRDTITVCSFSGNSLTQVIISARRITPSAVSAGETPIGSSITSRRKVSARSLMGLSSEQVVRTTCFRSRTSSSARPAGRSTTTG